MGASILPVLKVASLVAAIVIAGVSLVPAEFTQAPDLEYFELGGAKVRIDFKLKPLTLVNFWAVWCLPCHEEMPQISLLAEKYGDSGLQSIGIAVESGGPPDVERFFKQTPELKVSYPILVGGDEALEKFGDIIVVPTTYLLDSRGRVLETYMGVTHDFYGEISSAIMKHLPPAEPEVKKVESPDQGDRKPKP